MDMDMVIEWVALSSSSSCTGLLLEKVLAFFKAIAGMARYWEPPLSAV
jgi:hypothetical protein